MEASVDYLLYYLHSEFISKDGAEYKLIRVVATLSLPEAVQCFSTIMLRLGALSYHVRYFSMGLVCHNGYQRIDLRSRLLFTTLLNTARHALFSAQFHQNNH